MDLAIHRNAQMNNAAAVVRQPYSLRRGGVGLSQGC